MKQSMSISYQLDHCVNEMPWITTADREAIGFRKLYVFVAHRGNYIVYWDKMSQCLVRFNANRELD